MQPLNKKLIRTLWRIRGQALAIALVIGSGLGVFIMTLGAIASLEETRDAYYERYRFAELFATLKRAPEHLVPRIGRIPGVRAVESRITEHVTLDVPGMDEPATGKLISLPEHGAPLLNDIVIRKGRRVVPSHPDEAVISEAFADAHGFGPGDHLRAVINGKLRELHIVGIALSPEYVYSIAPGAILPDDRRFGILWMGRKALAAAYDLDGAFNDVSLTLMRGASARGVIRRLDLLLETYGGTGAIERKDQISNWFLTGEIRQLRTLAAALPVIFLAVGAFLLNMVLSRLVTTERQQIGLLKAFGYGNAVIGWHYLKLVLALTVLGILFGFAAGIRLGQLLTEMYSQFFRFPFLYFHFSPSVFVLAAFVSLAAALAGTLGAVRRAVTLPPAQAMLPPSPPLYRHGIFRHLSTALRLDQPSLMILRRILRWPLRSSMTILGIALSATVFLTSWQWLDAIDHLLDVYFFRTQHQEVTISLVEPHSIRTLPALLNMPGVMAAEPFRAVPVTYQHGPRERRGTVLGIERGARLSLLYDRHERTVTVPEEGILMSTKLAELLAVSRGDMIRLKTMEGRRPVVDVPVTGLFETYIGTPAYMDLASLNRVMLEGPTVSGAHLALDSKHERELLRELKRTPRASGIMMRRSAIESFHETLARTMNIMVLFYVGFATLITFGVVYNSARIALSERSRELASLRVMGFSRGEISYILLGELALLTLLALPLGCLMGYGLSSFLATTFDNELYRVPVAIAPSTFGLTVLVVVCAAAFSGLLVRRRMDRMDLIAALKTRE